MNERIRQLAEQAGWMMGDEVEGFNIRLDKFAELIVRECAGVVQNAVDHREPANTYVDKIKQHFGVE